MTQFSNRVRQIGKSAIHEMTRLSQQYEDVAFLSWARPTSGTPEHINAAAIAAIENGLTAGYSQNEGIPELREEIVKKLDRDNHVHADASQVIVTVGAIEGLAASVMAVVDPGDEVIMPSPTYSAHIVQVKLANGKPVFVPLVEEDNYALDLEGIEKAITSRTRAILFCSPNNPTGTVFPEKALRRLAEIALEHDLVIITDEAYEYFVFDDEQHFSIASMPEMKKNVISNYTFTKTYAMTGWRVGYTHADEEVLVHVQKAHIPFSICAPVVSQYAAIASLKGSQQCVTDFRSHYARTRDLMCRRLDRLPHVFTYNRPGGSYLMFPRIVAPDARDSVAFSMMLLQELQVSTTPGRSFGPTGEHHIRLSFCVPLEMIDKAFDRMDGYFGTQ